MDLASLSLSLCVCVVMVCLRGIAHCSSSDCCPEIPTRPLTKPPSQKCFKINDRFRYTCVDGYTRKAGTSNLIKCNAGQGSAKVWTPYNLNCIPDPHRTTTELPKTTVPREHTDTPHDSIITTTVTPSTSQQLTPSSSISASVSALQTESTEPTSSGPDQWSLSDTTQDVKTVTVTRAATCTSTSTLSPGTVKGNNTFNPDPESITGSKETTAAVVSCVLLMIIIAGIVIWIRLYCRGRRNTDITPQPEEELTFINQDPSSVPAVMCE
ncbi:interleukin-15 receptor subunit alpha isoform X1 [Scomber scombrus]|uniref:interleukin-15 receptor subunit alpha isoform X1 n=1 Tax=Scomber scombrus TaxID=13677 RepID=UPI002DDBF523|nr:interleukin-15 receptor subunit alpha isoform X1 [Scomber scombrus]